MRILPCMFRKITRCERAMLPPGEWRETVKRTGSRLRQTFPLTDWLLILIEGCCGDPLLISNAVVLQCRDGVRGGTRRGRDHACHPVHRLHILGLLRFVSSDSGMTFDSRQCRADARSLGLLLSHSGLRPYGNAFLPSLRGDLHLRGAADRA